MLKGIREFAAAMTIFLALTTCPQFAAADQPRKPPPGPGYVWKCIKAVHYCDWFLRSSTHKPGTGKPGDKPRQVGRRVCHLPGGGPQACSSVLGEWSNSEQCYMRREEPQPPFSDYRWQGHTDGSLWACVREQGYDKGKHIVTKWVWLPGKPTVVVDPLTLVHEAIADMHLAPPVIRTAPNTNQIGLVNMPVWMWVTKSENTWGPIVRRASVPGLSVTATAEVKAINWSMGDGKTVRCEGPGTPYSKAMGTKASPTCGHRYVTTSRKLPHCKYPVTAVAQWDITWKSTLGDPGQIGMTQQATTQLRIGEAVPVLVDPNGAGATASSAGGC
ncbi:hypothetical protein ACQHIV_17250 [Kribbella sp. GL6]|uniref:hypothetical protein n=1 Tax=Kribbella sp. GL6 TaxID=3419765 RepID=UPI003D02F1F9